MNKAEPNFNKRRTLFSLFIVGILVGIFIFTLSQTQHLNINTQKTSLDYIGYYQVKEVSDGDTIVVDMDGKNESVRFIGVDTPETHKPNTPVQCWGPQASEYTKQIIGKNGNKVRLEADPINTNRDRYNRLLRYVYLKDGTLLNSQLIKDGQGFAYTSFPFQKSEEFKLLGETAKNQNLGVWASCNVFINKYGSYESNP